MAFLEGVDEVHKVIGGMNGGGGRLETSGHARDEELQSPEGTGAISGGSLRVGKQSFGFVGAIATQECTAFLFGKLCDDVCRELRLHIEEQIIKGFLRNGRVGVHLPHEGLDLCQCGGAGFRSCRLFTYPAGARSTKVNELAVVFGADGEDAAWGIVHAGAGVWCGPVQWAARSRHRQVSPR